MHDLEPTDAEWDDRNGCPEVLNLTVPNKIQQIHERYLAAGADGLMIEVHPNPSEAVSDGHQTLNPAEFEALMRSLEPIAEALSVKVALI